MDKNIGFYGNVKPIIKPMDGMVMPIYRDAGAYFEKDGMRTERQMKINGQSFFVTSVFPTICTATLTE